MYQRNRRLSYKKAHLEAEAMVQKQTFHEHREQDGMTVEVTRSKALVKSESAIALTLENEIRENGVQTIMVNVIRMEEKGDQLWIIHEEKMIQEQQILQERKESTCIGTSGVSKRVIAGRLWDCFSEKEIAV